jgi:hypothetical protein
MNNSSVSEIDIINNKIQLITRQTDYTEDIIREKLKYFNFDEIAVIKDYLGIVVKPKPAVKSINQAIYKEIRGYLDSSLLDYHKRVDNGEVNKVV